MDRREGGFLSVYAFDNIREMEKEREEKQNETVLFPNIPSDNKLPTNAIAIRCANVNRVNK